MGPVEVPADRLWGAQTERSRHFFAAGGPRFVWTRPVIRALGLLKKSAARANAELGLISPEIADLITAAADEVIAGTLDAEFPLVVFQTGSGTQSNMNANEVIANRANQLVGRPLGSHSPVHPNDHVNRGQSSNDGFPVVMHVATVEGIVHRLFPAVTTLRNTLAEKSDAYAERGDDGPHAPARRGAGDAGTGDRRVGRANRRGPRAGVGVVGRSPCAGVWGHRGRHRPQRASAIWRRRVAVHGRGNRAAVPRNQQSLCGAVGPRRHGRRERRAPDPGVGVDEDGQRRAPLRVGAARRHRRVAHSGERARLVDHAGQDQPDAVRSHHHGVGAGVRQRRHGGVREYAGSIPAERLQAGDPAQRARVRSSSSPTRRARSICTARAASSRTWTASAGTSKNR